MCGVENTARTALCAARSEPRNVVDQDTGVSEFAKRYIIEEIAKPQKHLEFALDHVFRGRGAVPTARRVEPRAVPEPDMSEFIPFVFESERMTLAIGWWDPGRTGTESTGQRALTRNGLAPVGEVWSSRW